MIVSEYIKKGETNYDSAFLKMIFSIDDLTPDLLLH